MSLGGDKSKSCAISLFLHLIPFHENENLPSLSLYYWVVSKDTQSAHFNSTYISYSTTALHPSMKAFLYLYLKHGWFYFCLALRKKFPRVEDKGSLLDVTFERVSASKSFGQFWANFSLAQSHQLFVFGMHSGHQRLNWEKLSGWVVFTSHLEKSLEKMKLTWTKLR